MSIRFRKTHFMIGPERSCTTLVLPCSSIIPVSRAGSRLVLFAFPALSAHVWRSVEERNFPTRWRRRWCTGSKPVWGMNVIPDHRRRNVETCGAELRRPELRQVERYAKEMGASRAGGKDPVQPEFFVGSIFEDFPKCTVQLHHAETAATLRRLHRVLVRPRTSTARRTSGSCA
jgi:hypothetical protein